MQIFLAPRSNETSYRNFLSTIENGVDYQVVAPYLNEEGKNALASLGKLYAWGNKETKRSSWDKMNADDLVLFYKGREKSESEGKSESSAYGPPISTSKFLLTFVKVLQAAWIAFSLSFHGP